MVCAISTVQLIYETFFFSSLFFFLSLHPFDPILIIFFFNLLTHFAALKVEGGNPFQCGCFEKKFRNPFVKEGFPSGNKLKLGNVVVWWEGIF